jgi:hypothetical protein
MAGQSCVDRYTVDCMDHRLPTQGEDPFPLFTDKANEKELSERIKEKYGTYRGACGIDVASITDDTIRFATQVLACKLLRKCHKDQVPMGAIVATEKCVAGVMMNWSTFLVNQFLMDYREAQEKGTKFHYAWLLILIALTAWREPKETQFLEGIHKPFLAVRYMSLWHTVHKDRHMDNNVTFYIYKETIQQCIEDMQHIPPHIVEVYKGIVWFKAGMHHIYIQVKKDPITNGCRCITE